MLEKMIDEYIGLLEQSHNLHSNADCKLDEEVDMIQKKEAGGDTLNQYFDEHLDIFNKIIELSK